MHNILNKIIKYKIKELKQRKKTFASQNVFKKVISKTGMILIGEIKLKSPSAGILGKSQDIIKHARLYEESGVDVISIITDKNFFNGNIEFIKKIKKVIKLPILQKDFILDPYQIYEAKIYGADAILLIARIVTKQKLISFVQLAQSIGVEPVVEIYDEGDLEKTIATATSFIAVNARDLQTFTIDLDKACELIKKIPDKYIKLGFSGVTSALEIKKYKKAGVKGILIGTSLMKTTNIRDFINNLRTI